MKNNNHRRGDDDLYMLRQHNDKRHRDDDRRWSPPGNNSSMEKTMRTVTSNDCHGSGYDKTSYGGFDFMSPNYYGPSDPSLPLNYHQPFSTRIDDNNTNGRNFYAGNDQHNSGGGGYGTSNNFQRKPSHRNHQYMNAPNKYDHLNKRLHKYPPQNNNLHVIPGVPKPMDPPLVSVKPSLTPMQPSCLTSGNIMKKIVSSPSENKAAQAPLAKSQENKSSPG